VTNRVSVETTEPPLPSGVTTKFILAGRHVPSKKVMRLARLLKIIEQEAPSGSHAVEQKFLEAIEEFTQGMPQTDDITFVVVEKCR
jgi:hypothetical protein